MDVELKYIHVCEKIIRSMDDSSFSLISIFNKFLGQNISTPLRDFCIVVGTTGPKGSYKEKIEIIQLSSGTEISKAEETMQIAENGGTNTFVAKFSGLVLPEFGDYLIRVSVNGDVISENEKIIVAPK